MASCNSYMCGTLHTPGGVTCSAEHRKRADRLRPAPFVFAAAGHELLRKLGKQARKPCLSCIEVRYVDELRHGLACPSRPAHLRPLSLFMAIRASRLSDSPCGAVLSMLRRLR